MTSLLYPLSVALCLLALASVYLFTSKTKKLPPGPRSLPVTGNLYHVPLQYPWLAFTEWGKKYGDVVHLHGLGLSIVLLNSMKAVNDLLDRRATIYSHRPVFPMVGQMMELDSSMPLMDYGPQWKFHRKLARTALSPESVKKYRYIQEQLAVMMCQLFLHKPREFDDHIRLTAGRIILLITYGLSVETADHEYIKHAEETMEMISQSTLPGSYLVDLFPQMKRLPRWLPFTSFFREAEVGREMISRLVTKPFLAVKKQIAAGTAIPSVARDLLEDDDRDDLSQQDYEKQVKWMCGALYGAGGETTYSTILTFVALMAMNPEKQKLLQEELDRVIVDKLPTVEDRPSLPYLEAATKETMRWHPALPLSIARRTAADDVYEGHFIPANTIVLPNVWAISSDDQSKYPSRTFAPERFLEEKITDPNAYAFGFGRRMCPGKNLADNSLFIMIATIMTFFDISLPLDPRGNEQPLELSFATGLVSYPKPYMCTIKPRSEVKAKLLEHAASNCDL
ncbi:cytochrome P450 [Athelia psychrophila]|uniref:Cytochrome P450 n=1 Tax=Athelia psychrophila TaxID=1759441 RepID=A0A166PQQ0_9AGAM|nr:cytochrome P450 [Fibularhizoctonia sp. CBS 109695]